jgi:hypothetical protein
MRWTNTGNDVVWGCKEKSGRVHWGHQPVDVEIARWLPIFLEGIREYQVLKTWANSKIVTNFPEGNRNYQVRATFAHLQFNNP